MENLSKNNHCCNCSLSLSFSLSLSLSLSLALTLSLSGLHKREKTRVFPLLCKPKKSFLIISRGVSRGV